MNENKKKMYDLSGPKTVEAMKKRHFDAYYCSTAAEAVEKALELIPKTDSVSWGGVMTVDELGLKQRLAQEGYTLIDRDTAKDPAEKQALMHQAVLGLADNQDIQVIELVGHLLYRSGGLVDAALIAAHHNHDAAQVPDVAKGLQATTKLVCVSHLGRMVVHGARIVVVAGALRSVDSRDDNYGIHTDLPSRKNCRRIAASKNFEPADSVSPTEPKSLRASRLR